MQLELTTEQVNQILNALAQQPYIRVHELINTIHQQGQQQLHRQDTGDANTLSKNAVPVPETAEILTATAIDSKNGQKK
ncbi:hypothetical protein [Aquimarina longa]|uniref:hypothetical protein n=1 Tax=Aquimarina longa TaxID=1080221 RepID=UPI0013966571|nr:hypothetical protein [Aquimarina longa]